MAEIVITEPMHAAGLDRLMARHSCHNDPGLAERQNEIAPLLAPCRALIVRNKTQVTADLLNHGPNIVAVGRIGVGLDNIDLEACKDRNIAVYPATGANAASVAEYVMTAALMLSRPCYRVSDEMIGGAFPRERLSGGRELTARTLGIIGFGAIGQAVATRARAFGLTIVAHDPGLPDDHPAWNGIARMSCDEVIAEADILTLHVPLTDNTRGLIDAAALRAMKPGAILINTARGGIVDEPALADALKNGHIAGAAIDVFSSEPLTPDIARLFAGIDNIILTPHVSGLTVDSAVRVSETVADRILSHLAGSNA